jgi:hypothetical protein
MSQPEFPHSNEYRLPPNETAPAVEPPTAGFIVQLFLIPGVIVVVIVAVWLAISGLAQDRTTPQEHLQRLRSNTKQRWHAAMSLASLLSDQGHQPLRFDEAFMAEMAAVLQEEVAARGMGEEDLAIRNYLCLGLGQFHVTSGLGALLKAAETERDPKERPIRGNAITAIVKLAEHVRQPLIDQMLPELADRLQKLAATLPPDRQELAGKLASLASEATELARNASRETDLGSATATLTASAAELIEQARLATTSAPGAAAELSLLVATISAHAQHVRNVQWVPDGELARVLTLAAHDRRTDDSRVLRERAVFAISVIGGEGLEEVAKLLDDGSANVRYNAATGMARHGRADPQVIDVLGEMLDPDDERGLETEKEVNRPFKQRLILLNGLKATRILAARNQAADLAPLTEAVRALAARGDQFDREVRSEARETLRVLESR